MKNTQIIFLLLILWMPTKAEIDNFNCGVQTDSSFVDERTQIGGWKLSSEGVIKILVVFAKFPDDDSNHNYWPSGGDPIGYQNIIDENETVGSYDVRNLTSYFSEMSFGNYIVIGDAISVTTPQNESSYTNNVGLAATDVMMNVVDPEVDFSDYDNWTRVGTYNQINEPDGKVDLITIVWRKNIWLSNVAGVNTSYVTNLGPKGHALHSWGFLFVGFMKFCLTVSPHKEIGYPKTLVTQARLQPKCRVRLALVKLCLLSK